MGPASSTRAAPRPLAALRRRYNHALFSATAPGTHITKHNGPTNKKLRVQLPLIVPEGDGCRLRVGDETHVLREGEVFIFDDSFEHEAWCETETTRVVLIFDIWHPDLSDNEIRFLTFLQEVGRRCCVSPDALSSLSPAHACAIGRRAAHPP